jgi:F-type H+-transporting ATPase subunit alpha
MVEILKQDQYSPLSLEDQVMTIFSGGQGYLDDLPQAEVQRFVSEFLAHVRDKYPDIPHSIQETGDLSKETQEKLHSALKEFKAGFKAQA